MMKKTKLSFTALALTGVLMVSAAAAGVRQIKAELRPDIKVVIDGREQTMRDANGDRVYPIVYEGTTYLPVRALGEALDQEVEWNGKTQTVTLTKSDTDRTASQTGPDAVTGATPKSDADRTTSQTGQKTADTGSYESRIAALSAEADELVRQAGKVTDLAGYRAFRTAYRAFEDKEEGLDDELEQAYKSGTLTAEQYRSLEESLERAEEMVDDLDEMLERRLGLDD